jgi:hypothetical protein
MWDGFGADEERGKVMKSKIQILKFKEDQKRQLFKIKHFGHLSLFGI